MKVKLEVSRERLEEVREMLRNHGIETDDEAELVLSERSRPLDVLTVREPGSGAYNVLRAEEIILMESFGHTVEVHTAQGIYQVTEPLYKLAALLDPEKFLRVSNSVVIAKGKVRRIAPTLSMKFVLTMEGGRTVDVTRSYYYIFKDAFGI